MMAKRPPVYVLICTINEGIGRVPKVLLPAEDGVRYVVSWQQTTADSEVECPLVMKERKDVCITTIQGCGLSKNRNHAMEVASALLNDPLEDAIFVIADDDEQLEPGILQRLRQLYGEEDRLDVALLRIKSSEDGSWLKPYPQQRIPYRQRPRTYYPSSVEMTFRRRLWVLGLRFDERFGLGSEHLCAGEEDVFLSDALSKGLKIDVIPEVLGTTSSATTGRDVLHVKALRSKGAVYAYRHSFPWTVMRSWREALSLARKYHRPVWPIFRNIWYGVKLIRS